MNKFSRKLALGAVIITVFICLAACKTHGSNTPTNTPTTGPLAVGDNTPTPIPTQDPKQMDEDNNGGEIIGGKTNTPTPTPTPDLGIVIETDPNEDPAGIEPVPVVTAEPSKEGQVSETGEVKSFFVDVDGVKVEIAPYYGLTLHPASDDDIIAAVYAKLATVNIEKPSNDTAKMGDFVNINYSASVRTDEFEDTYFEDDITGRLGTSEFPYGFDAAIVGTRVGDVTSCKNTFPDNYADSRYAGKTVNFTITINYIYTIGHPQCTDEDVSEFFGYNTASEFTSAIRKEANRKSYVDTISTYLLNNCEPTGISKSLISQYSDFLYQYYIDQANNYAYLYDYDTVACLYDMFGFSSLDVLRKQTDGTANSSYQYYYILRAIAQDMKINLDDIDYSYYFNQYISQMAHDYNDFECDYFIYQNIVYDFIIANAKFE